MYFIYMPDPIRIEPICVFAHIKRTFRKRRRDSLLERGGADSTNRGWFAMFDFLFIAIAVVAFIATALYLPACDGW